MNGWMNVWTDTDRQSESVNVSVYWSNELNTDYLRYVGTVQLQIFSRFSFLRQWKGRPDVETKSVRPSLRDIVSRFKSFVEFYKPGHLHLYKTFYSMLSFIRHTYPIGINELLYIMSIFINGFRWETAWKEST